jgi:hypothetical protein
MYSIDLTLKYSPIPLSVQRKEQADAEALFQQIKGAMGGAPQLLELTCEKQTEKKIAVLSDQISAVILSDKAGAANSDRRPGFLSLGAE